MARDVNVQPQERDRCAHVYKNSYRSLHNTGCIKTPDGFLNEITF